MRQNSDSFLVGCVCKVSEGFVLEMKRAKEEEEEEEDEVLPSASAVKKHNVTVKGAAAVDDPGLVKDWHVAIVDGTPLDALLNQVSPFVSSPLFLFPRFNPPYSPPRRRTSVRIATNSMWCKLFSMIENPSGAF